VNKQSDGNNGFGGSAPTIPDDAEESLFYYLTVLSLCICEEPDRRIESLFKLCEEEEKSRGLAAAAAASDDEEKDSRTIRRSTVNELVTYLQKSCQIPADVQVVETGVEYPLREYKIGRGADLVNEGVKLLWEEGSDLDNMNFGEFRQLLRSRGVCYCGECYKLRKKGD